MARITRILQQSKEPVTTMEPLERCVELLKKEMATLNTAIRDHSNRRCEISLREELRTSSDPPNEEMFFR